LSIGTALNEARRRLAPNSESAALDGQVLLAHLLGVSRAWVLAHPEAQLSPEQESALQAALDRLEGGEPLPYVLGHWEFYGLDLIVTPEVLIPRPETELLVEQALSWLGQRSERHSVVDVGSGSGCIAVALAVNLPGLRLLASDISGPALRVSRRNALKHQVDGRVDFVQADLLPPTAPPFDLICANLPYIPLAELKSLPVYRFEPLLALSSGADGLDLIGRLLRSAPPRLAPGGMLLLEIEASQGSRALALARSIFPLAEIQVLRDLAGRERLLRIVNIA
jgi:release factor glutamine methyltransferase